MARVLVVFTRGPHGDVRAREGLELALAAIAFEHEVGVLFRGDGVQLLRAGQDTAAAGHKDFCRAFRSLPLHGLARAGVDADALHAAGVARDALLLDAIALDTATAAEWIGEADVVFTC